MKKTRMLCLSMVLVLLLLFSSNSLSEKFLYDGWINWETTSEDIIKKLGEPSSTKQMELPEDRTIHMLIYENVKYCDFDGFKQAFSTYDNDNKLVLFGFGTNTTPDRSKIIAEEIYNSLVSSYGKPVQKYFLDESWENGNSIWSLDDTYIFMEWSSSTEIEILSSGSVTVEYMRKEGTGLNFG